MTTITRPRYVWQIRGWLAPPELPTGELRTQARALWLVSWPFLAVVTVVLGLAVLVEPETLWRRATTVSAVSALVVLLHLISRRGKPGLASWMLVLGLSVIVTQRAWITGGIHAPVAVFFLLFILMAGALLGARGALTTAAVCFAAALLLTGAEAFGWLAPPPGAGPPLAGLVFVVLAIALALVVQLLRSVPSTPVSIGPDAVQMYVHDMRSPIHVLLAHLEILRENANGSDAMHVQGALGGATAIHRMTTNLLAISRLDAARLPVRRVATDVAAIAREVVETFRILQQDRDILVFERGTTACRCDPVLTKRMLENLVSNAIKHTPSDSRIVVAVSATTHGIRITVRDEGPGIPVEDRARLFEPFGTDTWRTASGFESSGLGLAFCRLVVDAQGGSIRVESAQPRGSVFVVNLPQ